MKICENGTYRDMTAGEIAAMERQLSLAAIAEKSRPLTTEEVSRMVIAQSVNALAVDDATALRMVEFYPEWAEGVAYTAGFKVRRGGKLWRVVQGHTSQSGWEPENVASIWERIDETHAGTLDDPIPYGGNMALEKGKHYFQKDALYLCVRDTGNPVYSLLAELVGIYVEVAG